MGSTKQFIYDHLVKFILGKYPHAVIEDDMTWYRGRVELDFYPHPRAIEQFACVVTPGHNPQILTNF